MMATSQPVPDWEQYIDVQDALKRVCGNKAIYAKLLRTFQKMADYNQLCDEIAAGDYETAARTAHGIKGVTANLSFKAAYEKVVIVESQLKQGGVDQKDLEELGSILDTTLTCIDYLLETVLS